jgi:hypothetical protein
MEQLLLVSLVSPTSKIHKLEKIENKEINPKKDIRHVSSIFLTQLYENNPVMQNLERRNERIRQKIIESERLKQ